LLLTSEISSFGFELMVGDNVVLGLVPLRLWSDDSKGGVRVVGFNSWASADVARQRDILRRKIYFWRWALP